MKKPILSTTNHGQPVQRKLVRHRKFSTLEIALMGMIAGMYAALTLLGGSLSFGPINLRFSNALLGLVPILGWPAVFGISLGVFLGNVLGPNLGPLDVFLSPIFSLMGLVAIQLFRKRSVLFGFLAYAVILSLWVNYLLSIFLGRPYFPWFFYTLAGIGVVVMVFSYLLYRGLLASGIGRRVRDVIKE